MFDAENEYTTGKWVTVVLNGWAWVGKRGFGLKELEHFRKLSEVGWVITIVKRWHRISGRR